MIDLATEHRSTGDAAIAWTLSGEGANYYGCYGLVVCSEIELPELVPVEPSHPDVRIVVGPVAGRRPGPGQSIYAFHPGDAYLAWDTVGAFRVTRGNRIEVDPLPGADPRLIPFPLLGPVIACLLSQRDLHVLHASAVSVNGHGAVLLGDKGAGKSTTAGLMIAAGHRLLADDVVAIDPVVSGQASIAPGFPQLKLADSAAQALRLSDAQVLDMVNPAIGKRQHRVASRFAQTEVPARRLYVLERGEDPGIEMLNPQHALQAVMRFSYMPRIDESLMSGAGAASFFRQCVALTRCTSIARLRVPQGLDRLDDVPGMIEHDLVSLGVEP